MVDDEEIVQAFLEESTENLDELDRSLVELELRPSDPDLLDQIFRTVHTIKGTSGFLGYLGLEALAHAGETLLGALRNGNVALGAEVTTSLLQLIDAIREILGRIEADGNEGETGNAQLIADLDRHSIGTQQSPVAAVVAVVAVAEPMPMRIPAPAERSAQASDASDVQDATGRGAAETSVRVNVEVLDSLMNLISELIVVRSQFNELALEDEDGPLAPAYRQLQMVTGELQERVMQARLQPVGSVIGKFRRIARDLAAALGKQVQVELEGEGIGVDRAVNEAIRDPMLHLVRNAIDHGIETPGERRAAGKPPVGTLLIRASHERGRVFVEVKDDGRGVDPQRLISRAVTMGIISAAEAMNLPELTALDLVFRPGLSTRESVTNLSGRGVGMDVVRTNLQLIGSSIEIESTVGVGTSFRINVPLTLAIMPTLTVWCDGLRYAIPQVNVEEVIHVEQGDLSATHNVEGTLIYRLRGRLLPSVNLAETLGVAVPDEDQTRVMVVLESERRRFALVVEAVGDMADVVVKPLTGVTRAIPVFMGVTILGDGKPSLILDVSGLAASAGISAPLEETALGEIAEIATLSTAGLLLASARDGGKLAVRLGTVRRLERFDESSVERLGDLDVVQYHDGILPLVRVAQLLAERRSVPRAQIAKNGEGIVHTVVCDSAAGPVGLVVETIDEVVPEPVLANQPASRRGVLMCFVIDERVVELLDVDTLAADAGIGSMP